MAGECTITTGKECEVGTCDGCEHNKPIIIRQEFTVTLVGTEGFNAKDLQYIINVGRKTAFEEITEPHILNLMDVSEKE